MVTVFGGRLRRPATLCPEQLLCCTACTEPHLVRPGAGVAAQVSKSPWKTVKYVFDRDVMAAFQVRG